MADHDKGNEFINVAASEHIVTEALNERNPNQKFKSWLETHEGYDYMWTAGTAIKGFGKKTGTVIKDWSRKAFAKANGFLNKQNLSRVVGANEKIDETEDKINKFILGKQMAPARNKINFRSSRIALFEAISNRIIIWKNKHEEKKAQNLFVSNLYRKLAKDYADKAINGSEKGAEEQAGIGSEKLHDVLNTTVTTTSAMITRLEGAMDKLNDNPDIEEVK